MDPLLSHLISFIIGCLTILYFLGYKIRPNLPPNLNIMTQESYLTKMIEIELKKNEKDILLREEIINQLKNLLKQNPNIILNKDIYAILITKLNEKFKMPISIQKNKLKDLINICLKEKDYLNIFSNKNILNEYLNISVDNFPFLCFINLFFQKLFKNKNYQNIWKLSLKSKLTVLTKNLFFKEIMINNVNFNSEIKIGKIFLFSENYLIKINKITKKKKKNILNFNNVKNLNELEIMKLYIENLKDMKINAASSIVFYIKLPIMEFELCLVCDFKINLKLIITIIDFEGYICLNLNEFLNFESIHSQKLRFSFFENPKFNLKIKILNIEDSGESNNLNNLNWIITSLSKTIKYLLIRNVIFPRFNYIPIFVTRLSTKANRPNLIKFIENFNEKIFSYCKPQGVWLWDEKTHYLMCNQKMKKGEVSSLKNKQNYLNFLFKEFKERLSEIPKIFLNSNNEIINEKNICSLSTKLIEFIPFLKYKHIHEFENISNYCLCFIEREYIKQSLNCLNEFNKLNSKQINISCDIPIPICNNNVKLNIEIIGNINYLKNKNEIENAFIEILELPLNCKGISLFHLSMHLLMKLMPFSYLTLINRIRNHLIIYLNMEKGIEENIIKSTNNKLNKEIKEEIDKKTGIVSYKEDIITIFLDDSMFVFKIKNKEKNEPIEHIGREFIFDDFLEKLEEDLFIEEEGKSNSLTDEIHIPTEINLEKEDINNLNGNIILQIFIHSKNYPLKMRIKEFLNNLKKDNKKESNHFPITIMKYIQKGLIFDHNSIPLQFEIKKTTDINSLIEIMNPEILVSLLNKTVIGIKKGRSIAYEINNNINNNIIIEREREYFSTIYLINERLFIYESSFNEKYGKIYISIKESSLDLCIFHIEPINISSIKENKLIYGLEKNQIVNYEGIFNIKVYSKIINYNKLLFNTLNNSLDLNLSLKYKKYFNGISSINYLKKTNLRFEKGSFGFYFFSESNKEYSLNITSSLGIDLLLDYDVILGESYFIFFLKKASIISLEIKSKFKLQIEDIFFKSIQISNNKEFIVFDCEKNINRYFFLENKLQFKDLSIFYWESTLNTKVTKSNKLINKEFESRDEKGSLIIENSKINIRFRNLDGIDKTGRICIIGAPYINL